MADFRIPAKDLMHQINMDVVIDGHGVMMLRLRLGAFLIRLAAWVMGCHVKVNV